MMAVKPYKGEVNASVPTDFDWEQPGLNDKPKGDLKLKHAFGYRCFDAKNMARYAKGGKSIVFCAASTGVQMNIKTGD
jgi:hypothetical protein